MNAPCPDMQERLDLDAAGWLSKAEARDLHAHLAMCPDCAHAHREARALAEALRAAAPVYEAPEAPMEHRRRPLVWAGWLSVAAAVLVALALPRAPRPSGRAPALAATWQGYRQVLANDQAFEALLERHGRELHLGGKTPALFALNRTSYLEDTP